MEALKGNFNLTINSDNMFIFEFDNDEDRRTALEYGALIIAKQFFLVRPWYKNIEQDVVELRSVLSWVNL